MRTNRLWSRNILIAYNEHVKKQVLPKVRQVNNEIDAPVSIYFSDELDVRW